MYKEGFISEFVFNAVSGLEISLLNTVDAISESLVIERVAGNLFNVCRFIFLLLAR